MAVSFVDEVTISIASGKGGPGCISFHREKFIPKGGPDGGDGGRGGDVIIVADPQLSTLLDYRYKRKHLAQNGRPGEGNQCSGADGETVRLRVPVGTVIRRRDTEEILGDLSDADAELMVAKGGRGGKGNHHFKSSVRQTPRFSQPGEPGEAFEIVLELKLLADVGLVGFPNVGKSSLIARMSAAKPKIANYPFTTLTPNLGVVSYGDYKSYVVADVPGLVVGAHEGVGLGSRFLRHIERVGLIVHLVTVTQEEERDPISDFEAIEHEIASHNEDLKSVPRVLVLNQMDLPYVAECRDEVEAYAKEKGMPFFAISAATSQGVPQLALQLGRLLEFPSYPSDDGFGV